MEKIIKSLNSSGLKQALDANNITFWSSFGRNPRGIISSDPDFFWSIANTPLYSYNGVLSYNLSEQEFRDRFKLFMEKFREKEFPLTWWINPNNQPGGVAEYLGQNGWKDEGFFPAMAAELENINLSSALPEGVIIRTASSKEERLLWTKIMFRGIGYSEKEITEAARIDSLLPSRVIEKQKRLIGFLEGEPVATALLLPDSGVLGIFGVATLPRARGRGIATGMTRKAMLKGKKLGFHVATLVSTPLGGPVYDRLGFKKLFSYRFFSWNH